MNDLLKLHKTVGGNKLNKLTYREYLDEHFNLGELIGNIEAKDNKLKVSSILPSCVLYLDGNDYEDKSPNRTKLTHSSTNGFTVVEQGKIGKGYHYGLGSTAGLVGMLDPNIFYGDFTVDFYTKRVANTGGWGTYALSLSASTQSRYYFGVTGPGHGSFTNNIVTLGEHSNNSYNVNSGFSCSLNVWYHVAFVRRNGIVTIYVDGKSVWSGAKSFSGLTGEILVGRGEGTVVNEYLDQIRIHKEALWTGNFTPPTYEDTTISNDLKGYRISPPIQLPRNVVSSKIDWEGEGKMSIYKHYIESNPNVGEGSLHFYSFKEKHSNVAGTWELYEDKERGLVYKSSGSSNALNLRLMPTSYDVTVSFGFYVPSGVATTKHYIFLNENGSSNRGVIWENGQIKYQHATGGVYKYSSGVTIPYDTWVDVVLHFTSSNIIIFIDGEQKLKEASCPISYGTNDTISLASGMMLTNLAIFNKLVDAKDLRYFIAEEVINIPLQKGESINSLPHNFHLKQEVKGEETISNVKLELKYKPKKEYIRPSNLKEEEDTNKTYLYKPGDECTPLTGGWGITNSSHNVTTPTYERTDRLRAHIVCGNSNGHHCGFITNKAIDLTGYSKIYFDMSNYHTDEYNRGLINIKSGSSSVASIGSPAYENAPRQIREIDISNINTSCIIQITAETVWNGKQAEVVIYNIWLEK